MTSLEPTPTVDLSTKWMSCVNAGTSGNITICDNAVDAVCLPVAAAYAATAVRREQILLQLRRQLAQAAHLRL